MKFVLLFLLLILFLLIVFGVIYIFRKDWKNKDNPEIKIIPPEESKFNKKSK